jgi:MtaA/CmuA family methyltransferase
VLGSRGKGWLAFPPYRNLGPRQKPVLPSSHDWVAFAAWLFAMNSRQRVLAHLDGHPVDRLPLMPITMMFAADLAGVRYRDYCTDYRLLAEAQIRTAEQFGFDYVNTMSDPAREAADCGAPVEFFDHQPAALNEDRALLADKSKLVSLRCPDPLGGGRMHNGVQAVARLRDRVGSDLIVEGWIEGPCAEGADLRGINALMLDFYDDPVFVRDLFEFVVDLELRFAKAQVEAGIDLMGVGDAAASLVGPTLYEQFIWPYEKKLVDGLHNLGTRVRLHVCGNTRHCLDGFRRLGCEIVDLDFPCPLNEARQTMGPDQVLLGNLHPVVVLRDGTPDVVHRSVATCHRDAGARYIVGAGCEVPRDTPHENLRALCAYAHQHAP